MIFFQLSTTLSSKQINTEISRCFGCIEAYREALIFFPRISAEISSTCRQSVKDLKTNCRKSGPNDQTSPQASIVWNKNVYYQPALLAVSVRPKAKSKRAFGGWATSPPERLEISCPAPQASPVEVLKMTATRLVLIIRIKVITEIIAWNTVRTFRWRFLTCVHHVYSQRGRVLAVSY